MRFAKEARHSDNASEELINVQKLSLCATEEAVLPWHGRSDGKPAETD
jgi:hypothetical protein